MQKIIFAAALLVVFAFAPAETLKIGDPMPLGKEKMMDVSGQEISLQEAMGKNGLLVMFSCNTCPYVIKNEQRSHDVLSYAQSLQVGVVVLNSNEAQRGSQDSFDAMKEYAAKQAFNWYYAMDKNHKLADAFGANRTPEVFLFNPDRKLVYHGAIDDSPADANAVKRSHLKLAIEEMTSNGTVQVKNTRSIGCNIKRKG